MSYANGFNVGYATGISDREDLIAEIKDMAQQVRDLKEALSICKLSYSRLRAEIENKRRGTVMTLPNWIIRLIVVVLCPVLFPLAVFEGAWNCVADELWPHIKDAWKYPEDTRWGKNRCKQ